MGWGGRLFEAGRLLTFSAFRMGAYSRWALIRGWALNRINTAYRKTLNCTNIEAVIGRKCLGERFWITVPSAEK